MEQTHRIAPVGRDPQDHHGHRNLTLGFVVLLRAFRASPCAELGSITRSICGVFWAVEPSEALKEKELRRGMEHHAISRPFILPCSICGLVEATHSLPTSWRNAGWSSLYIHYPGTGAPSACLIHFNWGRGTIFCHLYPFSQLKMSGSVSA